MWLEWERRHFLTRLAITDQALTTLLHFFNA